jgi:hypothetical protein
MWWPFSKKPKLVAIDKPPELLGAGPISFTQLDITDNFGDNERLGAADWIRTTPLNLSNPDPAAMGLPSFDATPEEIYQVAEELSRIRESIPIPDDGVYCPVCHQANIELSRLRSPCPQCGRPLLKFGWD